MNIFVLDTDEKKCAEWHNDSHVVKMISESAQLLSVAVRLSGVDAGYKLTHVNHPCAKWVRESKSNWLWLRRMAGHLHDEWKFRYGHTDRVHKAYAVILELPVPDLPDIGLTEFALAMPDEYVVPGDPVASYRKYYIEGKPHLAEWRKRGEPEWFTKSEVGVIT